MYTRNWMFIVDMKRNEKDILLAGTTGFLTGILTASCYFLLRARANLLLGAHAHEKKPLKGPPKHEIVAHYQVVDAQNVPIGIRRGPNVTEPRTGEILTQNEIFAVAEIRDAEDDQQYLRLADGRGWAFTRSRNDGRVLIVPVSNKEVTDTMAEEIKKLQAFYETTKRPSLEPLLKQSGPEQPSLERPSPEQPSPWQPSPEQPNPQPSVEQARPEQRSTESPAWSSQAQSSTAQSIPAQSSAARSIPALSSPAQSSQAQSIPAESIPAQSTPAHSSTERSIPALSTLARGSPARSSPAQSMVRSSPAQSNPAQNSSPQSSPAQCSPTSITQSSQEKAGVAEKIDYLRSVVRSRKEKESENASGDALDLTKLGTASLKGFNGDRFRFSVEGWQMHKNFADMDLMTMSVIEGNKYSVS